MPQRASRRIAVVGSGISGLSCAWLLSRSHQVTLFEKDRRVGGHSHTVDAHLPDGPVAVDTGFIVYNDRNYPNLVALFDALEVPTAPSNMGFSVSARGGRVEYSGNGMRGVFAQKRNLVNPRFLRMLADIKRFYAAARDYPAEEVAGLTIGDLLRRHAYSTSFIDDHLLPMAAAIWSTPLADVQHFPAAAFIRFFANHGLLDFSNRPQWRTVVGGSREYVARLLNDMSTEIKLNAGIDRITRSADHVELTTVDGETSRFDEVVLATHADQGLGMLADADAEERDILGRFSYSDNLAVLHTDVSLLPRRRSAWASWNYMQAAHDPQSLCVSYLMNELQPLATPTPMIVTLNPIAAPDPARIHGEYLYQHPVFDPGAMAAQSRLWSLQGRRRTWFCGAYFGYGFHEDGLQAGLGVAELLGGVSRPWAVDPAHDRVGLKVVDRDVQEAA